ncbi:MAG: hypothetical protein QG657_880, partial [Acidobacteriota bacterium]|nr:hypothetical protein [Acidobacteriota bacterium]
QRVVDRLEDRFNKGAVMIFEGGTLKRDLVYWMRRYNKSSINPLKKTIGFNIINEKFPGLSIIDRQNKINKIQKYY